MSDGLPDRSTTAARDGDAMHAVSAARIALECGLPPPAEAIAGLQEAETAHAKVLGKAGNRSVVSAYTTIACGKIRAALSRFPDAHVALEQPLALSRYIPDGSGIADLIICGGGVLEVIDFKSGRGKVEAPHNPQLMLYALGALDMWRSQKVETIRTTIIQPRIFNHSTWEIPRKTLTRWAATRLRRTARLAFAGEGELRAGEHCRYCRAKDACAEYAKHEQEKENSEWESP